MRKQLIEFLFTRVSSLSAQRVVSSEAYLLFYELESHEARLQLSENGTVRGEEEHLILFPPRSPSSHFLINIQFQELNVIYHLMMCTMPIGPNCCIGLFANKQDRFRWMQSPYRTEKHVFNKTREINNCELVKGIKFCLFCFLLRKWLRLFAMRSRRVR